MDASTRADAIMETTATVDVKTTTTAQSGSIILANASASSVTEDDVDKDEQEREREFLLLVALCPEPTESNSFKCEDYDESIAVDHGSTDGSNVEEGGNGTVSKNNGKNNNNSNNNNNNNNNAPKSNSSSNNNSDTNSNINNNNNNNNNSSNISSSSNITSMNNNKNNNSNFNSINDKSNDDDDSNNNSTNNNSSNRSNNKTSATTTTNNNNSNNRSKSTNDSNENINNTEKKGNKNTKKNKGGKNVSKSETIESVMGRQRKRYLEGERPVCFVCLDLALVPVLMPCRCAQLICLDCFKRYTKTFTKCKTCNTRIVSGLRRQPDISHYIDDELKHSIDQHVQNKSLELSQGANAETDSFFRNHDEDEEQQPHRIAPQPGELETEARRLRELHKLHLEKLEKESEAFIMNDEETIELLAREKRIEADEAMARALEQQEQQEQVVSTTITMARKVPRKNPSKQTKPTISDLLRAQKPIDGSATSGSASLMLSFGASVGSSSFESNPLTTSPLAKSFAFVNTQSDQRSKSHQLSKEHDANVPNSMNNGQADIVLVDSDDVEYCKSGDGSVAHQNKKHKWKASGLSSATKASSSSSSASSSHRSSNRDNNEASRSENSKWSCKRCSFSNDLRWLRCELCTNRR